MSEKPQIDSSRCRSAHGDVKWQVLRPSRGLEMEGAAGAARGAVVAGSEYVPDGKFVFESVYRIVPYDVRVERELAVVLCILVKRTE